MASRKRLANADSNSPLQNVCAVGSSKIRARPTQEGVCHTCFAVEALADKYVASTIAEFMMLHEIGSTVMMARSFKASFEGNQRHAVHIYVMFGSKRESRMECFNLQTRQWSPVCTGIEPVFDLADATAVTLGGQMYVCGGKNAHDVPQNSLYLFEPRANEWRSMAPTKLRRYGAAAVAVHRKIYLCGGCGSDGNNLSSVECYSAQTEMWETAPPMSVARFKAAAAAPMGQVYICTGLDRNERYLSSMECFCPLRGSWEGRPSLPTRGICGAVAGSISDRLYVCGGAEADSFEDVYQQVHRFNPGSSGWETVASMSIQRFGHAGIASGGHLYVFGGKGNTVLLDSAEVYHPTTNSWEQLPTMLPDPFCTACALSRTKV
eukprot:TRINITY_DN12228_c0_g1_i1.p1 TRINITY_DN12228_c0_g1~~TRINITY_DN12228_c0_g1_i1.p1  ORF type:complete len:378 (-),score=46.92 TRINITY_DN12228_c0_g1_i1:5-1138(-)